MRLLHIADLHLGKRLFGHSLLPDQAHALAAIASLCEAHEADAVLIAGDVYDRAVPGAAAVSLLDDFLTALLERGTAVFLIAGNHDSPERLQFASRVLAKSGLFICAAYDGRLSRVTLKDAYGPVAFTLLPTITPYGVRRFFPGQEMRTADDAVKAVLGPPPEHDGVRRVLLMHQYVTEGAGDAFMDAGGLEAVSAASLYGYDYVALGHIHKRYAVGAAHIRYAGSPLKYAFDDVLEEKGALMVDIGESTVETAFMPIRPLRNMRVIRGPIEALIREAVDTDDFLHAVLTDVEEAPDAMRRLRAVYPHMLHISRDSARAQTALTDDAPLEDEKSVLAHFVDFYTLQNGRTPDDESMALVRAALEKDTDISV